ncbi:hypothetical protein L1049_024974 [Liquidambar formosana]|uniref:Uncharacterized protein n=1 Tax=Liquidambar formosana TaxID=63359 RepID=A0AAP0X585_LIQFO
MDRDEIMENVAVAMGGVVGIVPKKWVGVRSFHLKFAQSLALPIYQALPDVRLKIEGVKEKEEEVVKEEAGKEVVKEETKRSGGEKDEKLVGWNVVRVITEVSVDDIISRDSKGLNQIIVTHLNLSQAVKLENVVDSL